MTVPTIASSIRGVNHLALVCSDMARTVDFSSGVLGFPLVKTVDWVFDASDVRHAPMSTVG